MSRSYFTGPAFVTIASAFSLCSLDVLLPFNEVLS
jgi:hypothetical protein